MSDEGSRNTLEINGKLLATGAALLFAGGLVLLAGVAVAATALTQTARKWVAGMDHSPTEIANRRLHQFKAAASAGSQAWRDQSA